MKIEPKEMPGATLAKVQERLLDASETGSWTSRTLAGVLNHALFLEQQLDAEREEKLQLAINYDELEDATSKDRVRIAQLEGLLKKRPKQDNFWYNDISRSRFNDDAYRKAMREWDTEVTEALKKEEK